MASNEKSMNFTHFHNSCLCNVNHLVLLIKTGNAYKERMLPQTITNIYKKCKVGGIETIKNDNYGKMVVVFTSTKINYFMVSLLSKLMRLPFVFVFVVLIFLAVLFALFAA